MDTEKSSIHEIDERHVKETLLESEATWRTLVNSNPESVLIVDTAGVILAANETAARRLNTTVSQLHGTNLSQWLTPDAAEERQIYLNEVAHTGVPVRYVDLRSHQYVEHHIHPVLDESGKPAKLIILSVDLTEYKHAEHEVRQRSQDSVMLYEMVRDLATRQEMPALLEAIVARATSLLDASAGFFYLFHAEQDELEIAASKNLPLTLGTRLSSDRGLSSFVVHSREPMIVEDYSNWSHHRPEFINLPAKAVVEVPVTYGIDLIGVLGLCHVQTDRRFADADAQRLLLFANQVASLIHNAQLYQQVRASRERLQILSYQLLTAQEQERRAIARELHDEIGQTITSVQMSLQMIEARAPDTSIKNALEDTMAMIDRLLQQVRDLSLNLRPSLLDDLGLTPALRWYVERQSLRSGLAIEFTSNGQSKRLPAELETVCFRVTQEAITNVVRHAQAKHACVTINQLESELQLTIQDDGVGFDVARAVKKAMGGASMGILGLQERVLLVGGRLEIVSAPKQGTRIVVELPLRPAQKHIERRARRRLP